jgi:hypothetical protein
VVLIALIDFFGGCALPVANDNHRSRLPLEYGVM